MVRIGLQLSSEEHPPSALVDMAVMAEEAGFDFAMLSDHFHPWIDDQGHGPFVWAVLGGIARATSSIKIGTGVTCPILRIHPAILAHATATVAAMMPGRFMYGVGTGENLNEHVLGQHWPPFAVRLEMLREAVDVTRQLWSGELKSHRGQYFTVENARLYTAPDSPPPILMAASGDESATLAGEIGDGLVSPTPDREVVRTFEASGGAGKPRYGMLDVCWASSEEEARRTAHRIWRSSAVAGPLKAELALPAWFDAAAANITEDEVSKEVVCGPDPEQYLPRIRAYTEAGFDHVYFHQVGEDQRGFLDFYRRELAPRLGSLAAAAG
jgi:G6PDH family F420-dependent oxidoreductase